MFELMENGTVVVLKTEQGRFVISTCEEEDMAKSPKISVDYQQVGKPVRNLAIIAHDTRRDTLKTLVFKNSLNSEPDREMVHVVHDQLESEELTQFEEAIKKAKSRYNGIDLEVHYRSDEEVYELCYVGRNDDRYTIQEFQLSQILPKDVEYCTLSHGLDYIIND